MKTLKISLTKIAMLFALVAFVSCGDDDDTKNEVKKNMIDEAKLLDIAWVNQEAKTTGYMFVKEGKKAKALGFDNDVVISSGETSTWEIKDGMLKFKKTVESTEFTNFKVTVTDTELKLDEEGAGLIIFTFKKAAPKMKAVFTNTTWVITGGKSTPALEGGISKGKVVSYAADGKAYQGEGAHKKEVGTWDPNSTFTEFSVKAGKAEVKYTIKELSAQKLVTVHKLKNLENNTEYTIETVYEPKK